MRLANRIAVITGGGGGIGRATALRFAREGARVVVSDLDADGAARTVDEIEAAGGGATFIPADVTDSVSVAALMEQASAWGGGFDILFNNAGVSSPEDDRVTEVSEDVWNRVLAVNLTGVFLCSKYGIPHLVLRGGGVVVNTASIGGFRANTAIPSSAYGVSKAGVMTLTRQCAMDYAKDRVRVNAICPGPIDTQMLDPFMGDPEVKRRFSDEIPIGRIGRPEDIADLVLFLASDESSWITGSMITIDGGMTAA